MIDHKHASNTTPAPRGNPLSTVHRTGSVMCPPYYAEEDPHFDQFAPITHHTPRTTETSTHRDVSSP